MRTSPGWRERLVAVVAILAAAILRAPGHAFPPGLYHDEAFYGLDGLATLADGLRLWYAANNGREPLFVWLVGLSEWALGPAVPTARLPLIVAVRLPALAASVVLVAAMYALASRLAGRRAGMIAAALTAVLPWATLLGRTGLRAGLLPAVLALAGAATLRGMDASVRGDDRRRWSALGGALAGLSLYTYTAARVLPVMIVLAVVLTTKSQRTITDRWPARPVIARWLAAAALVALPLVVAMARTPGAWFGRLGQVAVTAEGGTTSATLAPTAAALLDSFGRTAGIVFVAGDRIARHNIPFRPVFGPPAAALWLLGVAVAFAWLRPSSAPRRRLAAALLVAATVAFSLPTALAADAPHFLRAVGLLPALVATAAIGGSALVGWAVGRWGRVGGAAAWALVAVAVALEGRDVLRYDAALAAGRAADPLALRTVPVVPDNSMRVADIDSTPAAQWARAYHAFEGGATTLAREVNASLVSRRRVWLDRRLRDGWASVPFLVPIDRVILTDPYDPVLFDGGGVAFLVPYGLQLDEVWAKLPPDARLTFRQPVLERGDQATQHSPLYVMAMGPAARVALDLRDAEGGLASAHFPDGPALFGADIEPLPIDSDPALGRAPRSTDATAIRVRTSWHRDDSNRSAEDVPPADDVTLFVHVLDAQGHRLDDGADAPLGQGVYPVGRWRDGDHVTDERLLWLPPSARGARIVVGLYAGDPSSPLRRNDGGGDGLTTVEIGRVP